MHSLNEAEKIASCDLHGFPEELEPFPVRSLRAQHEHMRPLHQHIPGDPKKPTLGASSTISEIRQHGTAHEFVEATILAENASIRDSASHPEDVHQWPRNCKYYVAEVMDAAHIGALLYKDSEYRPRKEQVTSVDISDGLPSLTSASLRDRPVAARLSINQDARNNTKLFFVDQKRHYYSEDSKLSISLHYETWQSLLSSLSVLPSFLELLHSNNGCFLSHVSYCANDMTQDCPYKCQGDKLSALHLGIKLGDWNNAEHAVYARHDLHTGHDTFLIIGTDLKDGYPGKLMARMNSAKHLGFFEILLHLASHWYDLAEEARWECDYKVQDLEARTGYSAFGTADITPLPREQLHFTKDLQIAADAIRNISFGSARIGETFQFLLAQMQYYNQTCKELPDHQLSLKSVSYLKSALEQKHSLAVHQLLQIAALKARADAQMEVTKTLISHRDTEVNIEIAKAAKADTEANIAIANAAKKDTEAMKGIAAVTMVFLPATFLATFFSMVFFHSSPDGSQPLSVDKWIWLYPAITVPLTVLIMTCYGIHSWDWRKLLERKTPSPAHEKRHDSLP